MEEQGIGVEGGMDGKEGEEEGREGKRGGEVGKVNTPYPICTWSVTSLK